jgi:SAM-dependent methyltransferase
MNILSPNKRWKETEKLYKTKKEKNPEILLYKLKQWKGFLSILKKAIKFEKYEKYLEVGGGGYPFSYILKGNDCIVIDPFEEPLYDKFSFKFQKVKIENFRKKEQFDKIFCFNVLDHVDDIERTLSVCSKLCKKQGFFIVALNTYNSRFYQSFFQRFNRFLDKPHPHHFMKSDIISLVTEFHFNIIFFNDDLEKMLPEEAKSLWFETKEKRNIKILIRNYIFPLFKDPFLFFRILVLLPNKISKKPFRPAKLYIFQKN